MEFLFENFQVWWWTMVSFNHFSSITIHIWLFNGYCFRQLSYRVGKFHLAFELYCHYHIFLRFKPTKFWHKHSLLITSVVFYMVDPSIFMGALVSSLLAIFVRMLNFFVGSGALFFPTITFPWSLMNSYQYFFGQYLEGSHIFVLSCNIALHFSTCTFEPIVGFNLLLYILFLMNSL